ncbi:hypothetical protein ACFYU9_02575 [Streptomyces sp. NPDC004327]|uniref:hypothetical protein n=1 Tax=unclassified Streptomyces TaxID=2593676 RepID=UPI0036B32565
MSTVTAVPDAREPRETASAAQGGPPPGVVAAVFAGLFVAGVVLTAVLAGGSPFPSPYGETGPIVTWFRDHAGAVRIGATLQFAAALPLTVYTATVTARLQRLGVRAPGTFIALGGGLLAAGLLIGSALASLLLTRAEVLADPGLVRTVQYLAFLTGGPGHVAPLGLLVAGLAVPGLLAGLLPRRFAYAGLAVAFVAQLTVLALLVEGAAVLLPLARFPGLIWLVAAGFLLPRSRPRTRTGARAGTQE